MCVWLKHTFCQDKNIMWNVTGAIIFLECRILCNLECQLSAEMYWENSLNSERSKRSLGEWRVQQKDDVIR